MRIIAGLAKGMVLDVPRGPGVRPTSDRVRGAIFSRLGDRVNSATVLDLYAGTGALGLEAASRGARAVTFVENSPAVLRTLEKNITAFRRNYGAECELRVAPGRPAGEFDLIFADPPYGDLAQTVLNDETLPATLADKGTFVLESAKRSALVVPAHWRLEREAIYGDTRVSSFRHPARIARCTEI